MLHPICVDISLPSKGPGEASYSTKWQRENEDCSEKPYRKSTEVWSRGRNNTTQNRGKRVFTSPREEILPMSSPVSRKVRDGGRREEDLKEVLGSSSAPIELSASF